MKWEVVSIRSPDRSQGRYPGGQGIGVGILFQSAPLTEAKGDKGKQCKHLNGYGFQSAPLTEAKGDRIQLLKLGLDIGFNPLP